VMRVIRHREEEIDPSWGRAMERHRAIDPMLSTLHRRLHYLRVISAQALML
jgi:hypothetical protein